MKKILGIVLVCILTSLTTMSTHAYGGASSCFGSRSANVDNISNRPVDDANISIADGLQKRLDTEKQQRSLNQDELKEKQALITLFKKLEDKNVDEIVAISNELRNSNQERFSLPKALQDIVNYVKEAAITGAKADWVIAAAAVSAAGHDLPATLTAYSALGWNYNENNGKFARAIRLDPEYTRISNQNSVCSVDGEFKTGDLFLAIHAFSYYVDDNKNVAIHDVFDFDLQDYSHIFVGALNNFAYLSQEVGVLEPIEVDIYIPKI